MVTPFFRLAGKLLKHAEYEILSIWKKKQQKTLESVSLGIPYFHVIKILTQKYRSASAS